MLNEKRIEKIRSNVRGLNTVEPVRQNISFWVELYIGDYNKYSKMIRQLNNRKFLVNVSHPLLPMVSSEKMILKEIKQVSYIGAFKFNEVPKEKELVFQYINCVIEDEEYYIIVNNDGLFECFPVADFLKYKKRVRNLKTSTKKKFIKGHKILIDCFNERADGIKRYENGDFGLSKFEAMYSKIESFMKKRNI